MPYCFGCCYNNNVCVNLTLRYQPGPFACKYRHRDIKVANSRLKRSKHHSNDLCVQDEISRDTSLPRILRCVCLRASTGQIDRRQFGSGASALWHCVEAQSSITGASINCLPVVRLHAQSGQGVLASLIRDEYFKLNYVNQNQTYSRFRWIDLDICRKKCAEKWIK